MKSSAALRTAFLEFFRERGHAIVPSSPLVPANDPTLLFTNAGMVQFKEVFLGQERRDYSRATTSQRCVRAGGKHNDLENVGYTARHHTFFEMLGNFSFGDYFKREAIDYAWTFLTDALGLAPERLWVTVFEKDEEAADIWLKDIGVDPARFVRIGAKDNFWSMGDTGPCGPCTEIFYDHGPDIPGGPPGTPDEDGDRYIEIWNLVFMEYERAGDGTLTPLPKPSVDTGMGLERLAAVMQGRHSNYDIDLFQNLISAAAELTGCADRSAASLKVIADHIRSCSFLVTDGVVPSNEGRGYVLRRIIRRAIRHGHKLGMRVPFFHKLVPTLVEDMGAAYPELVRAREQVMRVLRQEEERFAETLDQGMSILEQAIAALDSEIIAGATVFKLYDTYGFPADLTADIARERGLQVDMVGFERDMQAQRMRARAASQFGAEYGKTPVVDGHTDFIGYDQLTAHSAVMGLFVQGEAVEQLEAGQKGSVFLARTPLYAESGGQIGDRGLLLADGVRFEVYDTRKQGGAFAHIGRLGRGILRIGDTVEAQVDTSRRSDTACNHSATHLMHAALRRVLGEHVTQKGSLVDADRLRFDFSHFEPVTSEQLDEIERLVNVQIRHNDVVETRVMSLDEALESGAMALFGEKYAMDVRVLSMGDFSLELCGGTHVRRTGDIGAFKIISEAGVAAGVRRIEALTGQHALDWLKEQDQRLSCLAELVKGGRENVTDKVSQLVERNRCLEKELEALKSKLASRRGGELVAQAVDVDGLQVLAACLDGADARTLRETVDQLKNKLGSAAVVLAAVNDGKISLVAGVTKAHSIRIKAGELVNAVATQVGGKGGGRSDMAQAGGTQPALLDSALASVLGWVRERLQGHD